MDGEKKSRRRCLSSGWLVVAADAGDIETESVWMYIVYWTVEDGWLIIS